MRRVPYAGFALRLAALLLLAAIAQRWLLRWAMAVQIEFLERNGMTTELLQTSRSPRLIAAIGAPIVASALGAALLFRVEMRRRARPLVEALLKVARGELGESMPAAPDPEFEAVRRALLAMQDALDRALRRLAHNDAQRRRLFADLAHELANPVSFIVGFADTIARPDLLASPGAHDRLMRALELQTVRLDRLVRDVRDLAELDDPDVSVVLAERDLTALAERVCDSAETAYGRSLVRDLRPCSGAVDAERIEQLLTNLLTNAIRHTPETRVIRVVAEQRDGVPVLLVEDAGPGVPDELLSRLGERLFRADASRDRLDGGHGLGLSIARAIARRHEGDLTFERSSLGGLRVVARLGSTASEPP